MLALVAKKTLPENDRPDWSALFVAFNISAENDTEDTRTEIIDFIETKTPEKVSKEENNLPGIFKRFPPKDKKLNRLFFCCFINSELKDRLPVNTPKPDFTAETAPEKDKAPDNTLKNDVVAAKAPENKSDADKPLKANLDTTPEKVRATENSLPHCFKIDPPKDSDETRLNRMVLIEDKSPEKDRLPDKAFLDCLERVVKKEVDPGKILLICFTKAPEKDEALVKDFKAVFVAETKPENDSPADKSNLRDFKIFPENEMLAENALLILFKTDPPKDRLAENILPVDLTMKLTKESAPESTLGESLIMVPEKVSPLDRDLKTSLDIPPEKDRAAESAFDIAPPPFEMIAGAFLYRFDQKGRLKIPGIFYPPELIVKS